MSEIKKIMKYETAGDPVTGLKWTKKTLSKISGELKKVNINVSQNTVSRILVKMKYSLKVNYKKVTNGGKKLTKEEKDNRDKQFKYINLMRRAFEKNNHILLSIDTKKKENVGNFKNEGSIWTQKALSVFDHDFVSYSEGKGIPFGIYEELLNYGCVFIGTSKDTAEFEVDAIQYWWNLRRGQKVYSGKRKILILSDAGGSSGYRSRHFKKEIQEKLCNEYKLEVTLCHYPPGASKWNPIEHRLFSEISKNWAGHPLISYEEMINRIKTTTTETGLKVEAHLIAKKYESAKGRIKDKEFKMINIKKHKLFPDWNYTIYPS